MTLLLAGICTGVVVSPVVLSQEPIPCADLSGLFATFDVVSVKPADPAGPRGLRDLPDGFDGTATVDGLLRTFYLFQSGIVTAGSANDDLITGLPSWAKDEYFSIQAKMSEEQFAMFAKLNRRQKDACQSNMVHSMLRDKFAFEMHLRPMQVPAYELMVTKSGSKLKPATGPARAFSIQPGPNGSLSLQANSMSTSQLANLLAIAYWGVHRNVVDKTGLVGKYSFTLMFIPPQQMTTMRGPENGLTDDFEPAISKPLEDQLGLRLQRTTATFNAIVVDHLERPGKD